MATGPVDRYRQWLQKNTELLAPMEIGFSALAYYAVSRSGEMSIAAEASYAAVGLFTLLNESVLTSDRATTPRNERLALAALEQLGTLLEVSAISVERSRGVSRYNALAAFEAIRAAVRLHILYRQGGRLSMDNLVADTTAAVRAKRVAEQAARLHSALLHVRAVQQPRQAPLPRRGQVPRPPLPPGAPPEPVAAPPEPVAAPPTPPPAEARRPFQDLAAQRTKAPPWRRGYWWQEGPVVLSGGEEEEFEAAWSDAEQRAARMEQRLEAARQQQQLAARRQANALNMVVFGEVLRILRRPAYALSLRQAGSSSWRPWLLSLAMELAASYSVAVGARLSQEAAKVAAAHPALRGASSAELCMLQAIQWTNDEQAELHSRHWNWLYYLLRNPLWEQRTQPALDAVTQRLQTVWIMGWLAEQIEQLLVYRQQYFTQTNPS